MRSEHIVIGIVGLLVSLALVGRASAQEKLPLSSLCDLQSKAIQGEHHEVRVEGVFLAGLEGEEFVDSRCSGTSTMIDLDLRSNHNRNALWRMVYRSYKGKRKNVRGGGQPVFVIFDGEFFGPPVPDPKLPPAILKVYHPGWDNNSMTKLDVYVIESVKPVPRNDPCAPTKANPTQWPCFQHNPESH
jgi:hypothetical protein